MAYPECRGQIIQMRQAVAVFERTVAGGRTIIVHGNSMLPLYRHGDMLIVSEHVPIAVGDRILVESRQHGTLGGTLLHRDAKCIAILLGGQSRRDVLVDPEHVDFVGRIVWASQ